MQHDFNFAGFRAPACLTVAEAMRVCGGTDPATTSYMVDQALAGAHNIQDAEFCAQTSARVNAMIERWWPPMPVALDVDASLAQLEARPPAFELAPLHRVGDTYHHRSQLPTRVPLPFGMREGRSLRDIVAFYPSMRSLAPDQVLALNPQLGLAGPGAFDQPLAPGTLVRIADDDFAPWIAARLSAEALVMPGVSDAVRTAWMRRLVPLAAANATALDLVLARSLMTAAVGDLDALDVLVTESEQLARQA
jgi:hypothetical protein